MVNERAGIVSEGRRLVEMRVGSDGVVRVVVASYRREGRVGDEESDRVRGRMVSDSVVSMVE